MHHFNVRRGLINERLSLTDKADSFIKIFNLDLSLNFNLSAWELLLDCLHNFIQQLTTKSLTTHLVARYNPTKRYQIILQEYSGISYNLPVFVTVKNVNCLLIPTIRILINALLVNHKNLRP